ncbi:hypothetical protein Pla52o_28410 [Novipirellula galeiformis]|uniref:Uncharacterized protein n=1 Tax=Novipirellula galeiformis TaxID=2528004 RepID=A0A5C6CH01_9BACT|nr:hypothetical protein [Novipirellula galeiformis]TWU23305.1 hypothetical protein Pla52o_28410 [Novipirellula galeiformis]
MSDQNANMDFSESNPIDHPRTVGAAPSTQCCTGKVYRSMALLVVSFCSVAVAAYFAGQSSSQPSITFPTIDATAAVTSEKFSMATGPVSEDAEGLFVLDHNSGLLQCSVIYPRAGRFMASFTANVAEALASGGKGGSYMLVTGTADFPRASNRPAAPSVVYVLDTATGNYACYGIPFNRQLVNNNQPQMGPMVLIATGTANPLVDRDALR